MLGWLWFGWRVTAAAALSECTVCAAAAAPYEMSSLPKTNQCSIKCFSQCLTIDQEAAHALTFLQAFASDL